MSESICRRFNTAKDRFDKESLSSFELSRVIGEVITDFYVNGSIDTLVGFLIEEVKPMYDNTIEETELINGIYERCEALGYYDNNKPKEIIALITATIS